VPEATGKNRPVAIATPLGEDEVVINAMRGTERVSELFRFEVSLLSENFEIELDDLLGENVTIRIGDEDDNTRYFNGYVTSFTQFPGRKDVDSFAHYQIVMSPWLWFLTRTSDCRIFQEKTVPDIIKEVMSGHGFDEVDDKLTEPYRTWEYCVQYRETDYNFVSRLMEQEGIYYYFTHEDGAHKMVLADAPSCHTALPHSDVTYETVADGKETSESRITDWRLTRQVRSGKFATKSFDFEVPNKDLEVQSESPGKYSQSGFAVYDYLGDYVQSSDGQRYANVRMEEIGHQYELAQGAGNAPGFTSGAKFTLTGFPREDQNREYLILGVDHRIRLDDYESGGAGIFSYENSFNVMDATTQFRAPQVTPKPEIRGPQTAIVAGQSEEIDTDEHGRVKVKFHWDRYAKDDGSSSCWIRVSQSLAGKGWGWMILPRVGQEVIVEYLEGDPDRPIITGRVYNGENPPPYELPANKTMSGVKTNSSVGGGGFNEIRFEDKKGDEQMFIHAQKNQDIRVLGRRFETVVEDRHLVVEMDKFEEVKQNRNEEVALEHKEKIGKDRHVKVEGKEALEIGDDRSLKVGGNMGQETGKDHSLVVKKKLYIKASEICLEADQNITLKIGPSSIAMNMQGVKIEGTQFEAKAKATGTVDGGGLLTVKGGMVKIN
jgi:type VI secretion system secreted protein VgrG